MLFGRINLVQGASVACAKMGVLEHDNKEAMLAVDLRGDDKICHGLEGLLD